MRWSPTVIVRTAGILGVVALTASASTNALATQLLISDEAMDSPVAVKRSDKSKKLSAAEQRRQKLLQKAQAEQAKASVRDRRSTIVENNIFCPSCKPAEKQPAEAGEPGEQALAATDLPLALLATMESDDPEYSMATILDTERNTTGVYSVNDKIRPGVAIAGIQRGSVVLRGAGGFETLGFPDPESQANKRKGKKKKKKKKRRKGRREIDGAREAIDCKGNACTVDRTFVEKLVKNPRLLARQAKVIPAVRDGETHGFRLHRVRRGTLPRLLGLKNGDTLMAVNGTELDSMDRALALYTKLRRAKHLSLTVERKGKVFEKQISIR